MVIKWKTLSFKKCPSHLCSFCKCQNENVIHLFNLCDKVNSLWMDWNNALFSGMSATDSFNSTLFNSKLASRSFWILQS